MNKIILATIGIASIAGTYFGVGYQEAQDYEEQLLAVEIEYDASIAEIQRQAIITNKIIELKSDLRVLGLNDTHSTEIASYIGGRGGLDASVGGSWYRYTELINDIIEDYRDEDGVIDFGAFTNFAEEIHQKVNYILEYEADTIRIKTL